jgi:hypothetical protein
MTVNDNGDIFRAVGFVSIYGAHLEDSVAELIDMTKGVLKYKDNIALFSASEQAKHLLKVLKKAYDMVPDYITKQRDIEEIEEILSNIDIFLKERHIVIHSTLISKPGSDAIIRKNRRTGIEEEIKSEEVIDLANDIDAYQSRIYGLKFPLQRLMEGLSKS